MSILMYNFSLSKSISMYNLTHLCCFSGEGTLTAFNLRRKKMEVQSELFDSEFLSMAVVKVRSDK